MAGFEGRTSELDFRDAFFRRAIHDHGRLLYRVAFSVLRQAADAEDAVGEALLKLLRSGAWRHASNERAFLARSVWHAALDRRARRLPGNDGDEAGLEKMQDPKPSPEWRAVAGEQHRLMHLWIEALPKELREPLLLSAVEELCSREIGELLHLPEGTVRTRLMRARQQLRTQFEEMEQEGRGREVMARGAEE